ncbi:disease resistance protein RPP5-like [Rosa chinensis]|nr:disease resistance protein RPP5-like [Rosa chinensis]XP_040373804.1 disease resistance protein RPP5-like [Rosa chinensis]XP_040373805.1 disease resistance protein RPP5-like [Rosa chinensis]XP_040373806.1 disease resistance protein RPP5-like [Rosa chinensis]
MKNLINLRHLYFDEGMEFPAGILRGLTNLRTLSYFNVGKEMGLGIEELVGLNQLKGELIIRNLQNIRDAEEAKKAKLEDKKNVLELSFVWTRSRSNPEGLEGRPSSNVHEENVLEGLQPHTKLESLRIENFMGDKFPPWMMRNPFPLNNLKKILLSGCRKCERLPILGHLPGLGHVEISEMHNLKRLGSEFYGYNHVYEAAVATQEKETIVLFPALKTLSIERCGELIEWMEAPTTMAPATSKVVVFPCLEKLTLLDCPLLRNAPSHFPSLKDLYIWGVDSGKPIASICREVSTLTSLHIGAINGIALLSSGMSKNNKNLTSLKIRRCGEMVRIAPNVFGSCANLKSLYIEHCPKLEHLAEGLDTLRLLEKLSISYCPTLEFIPIDHDMASLRELEIQHCDRLSSIGLLDHCTSLQELRIWGCRNLTSIPISQGLASLCKLDITQCDVLSSIGILDHCTSLQELQISNCRNLTSIPISQGLASLRELNIWNCGGLTGVPCGVENCSSLQKLSLGYNDLPNRPALRKLAIWACDGLTGLPSGIENCTPLQELVISCFYSLETISFTRVFPSLRKLQVESCDEYCPSLQELIVYKCPKLSSISFSADLNPCLKELHIEDCNGLQSLPDFRNFTSLLVLEISGCAGIESLVCGFHIPVSLEELRISQCHNLESIPSLEECTSLRQLEVRDCEKLKPPSTGLRCLARLEKLDLGPFWEELDSFPDFQAPSQQLGTLLLRGWPKLKSLPEQVQHFTSLTELVIVSFNGVQALPEWLSNLASLKYLGICDCENLKYLPSLKVEYLRISGCPLLKERCTREWPKISHIPNINFSDY